MSNGNFFSQDDDEPFNDIPEEVSGQSAPVPQVRANRPPVPPPVQAQPVQEPEYEQEEAEELPEEEEDFTSVLTEARYKLELGRLYEMLMNHDIFSGAEADDKAIKYVMKQIKTFAKEQMEIMLGMRQPANQVQALAAADFPFNDLEVQTLKALASAATKGATASPEAQSFTPLAAQPAKVGLNTISAKPQARPTPKPVQKVAQKQAAPLPSKPATPVKRNPRTEAQIEQILAEEGISREEYERQYNPNYQPIGKPLAQMTEQEMIERNKMARTRRAVNPNAIPMPSPEQEEMIHTQRANAAAANPQMQSIISLLTQNKK